VGETHGMVHVCVPASVIEMSGSSFVQTWQQSRRDPTASEQQWLNENLGRVRLRVTADVQSRLKTRELLSVRPGHVLNLGLPLESPVTVRVGDVAKFKGRLATCGGLATGAESLAEKLAASAAQPDEAAIISALKEVCGQVLAGLVERGPTAVRLEITGVAAVAEPDSSASTVVDVVMAGHEEVLRVAVG